MKRNKGKYETVVALPSDAMTIAEKAELDDVSVSYVYHKLTRGKAEYKIVIWKGINFVVPLGVEEEKSV